VRIAQNLTIFMRRVSSNLRASTSWNTQGLSRPVMRLLYLHTVKPQFLPQCAVCTRAGWWVLPPL